MLDGVLEQALASSGLHLSGETCIQHLDVPVRVRLSSSDAGIAAAWSRAFATALEAAVTRKDSGVVVYASRGHGLLDMAAGVVGGRLERAWAWHRLGLWPASTPAGDVAVDELVNRLEALPAELLPVLGALAGMGLLGSLAERLEVRHWERLAAARADGAGIDWTALTDLGRAAAAAGKKAGPPRAQGRDEPAGDADELEDEEPESHRAAALIAGSSLFAALAASSRLREAADSHFAAALLVLLEVDPGIGGRGSHAGSPENDLCR